MTPPTTTPLQTAASRRTSQAEARVRAALTAFAKAGAAITFSAVAAASGVSRQFLYTHPDLRAEIEHLRDREPDTARLPVRERDGNESLRTRLRAALEDNQRLRDENKLLKDELAIAHGQLRDVNSRHSD